MADAREAECQSGVALFSAERGRLRQSSLTNHAQDRVPCYSSDFIHPTLTSFIVMMAQDVRLSVRARTCQGAGDWLNRDWINSAMQYGGEG